MEKDISNEIVSGGLYPSCVGCHKAGDPCEWKMGVIHLRPVQDIQQGEKLRALFLQSGLGATSFGSADLSLKRAAEDAEDASAPPKVLRLECPDVVAVLQNLNGNIGTLVKLTAASSAKSARGLRCYRREDRRGPSIP